MQNALRQTRTHLMTLFEGMGINPRSDLGQNFLIDLNIIDFIVKNAELSKRDVVLEVGSGTGSLTTAMAAVAAAVVSVEIDTNMFAITKNVATNFSNVTPLNCDILKNKNTLRPEVTDLLRAELAKAPGRRLKLIANLPYHVATPVVSNLVASDLPWDRMVVTIQAELGQRMAAGPGKSNYGALSAWLNSQCHVRILRRLGPQVFWPRPAVNSVIVQLLPAPGKSGVIADRPFFQDFLRRLFAQRRKLLRPVLVSMYRKQLDKATVDALLTEIGFPEKTRAETLQPYQLVQLGNRVFAAVGTVEPADATEEE